ncbi:NADPH-dependent F420 reductase [Ottowia sp.]|uniref:NADPH-dependent F420 reductase n=1 Tax=Ottowia sp. TaxID=1898956 RepID=UPI003A8AFDC5
MQLKPSSHAGCQPRRRSVLQTLAGLAAASALPAWPEQKPTPTPTPAPLRIGVIGAGWLGGTVGRLWVRSGHQVMFASRNLDRVRDSLAGLGERALVGTPAQAADFGDVLLFAVPYDALPQLGKDLAKALSNKIVLDACNPSPGSANTLTRQSETDGVGALSARLLPGTRLVRAFSAVDATAVEASYSQNEPSRRLGVPLASDDTQALQTAAQLVRDAGCEPVIVGNLAAARAFQRGGPGFRANTTAPELRRRMKLPANA